MAPLVDVTVPVHNAVRPIARAVSSIVDHTRVAVRVNVVAHNVDPDVIGANLGALIADPRVRLLSLRDGIHSPAGPMNYGIAHSDAPFIAVMGSDDELAPGALDSWLALAQRTGATTVLARVDLRDRIDPYPPVRRGRRRTRLDARKDRLAYRSAPLGLIDRRRFGQLRFTEGLASGEDLAYSATLWFTGHDIAYDLTGPAYIVNSDAGDRVTFAPRAVADDFEFLDAIEATPWFAQLGRRARTALAIKVLRVHFFDAVLARANSAEGIGPHRDGLNAVADRLDRMAPGVFRLLARVDNRVVAEVRSASPDPHAIRALLTSRWNYRSVGALVPADPLLTLHRQAPLRTLYAGLRSTTAG